jgi:prepilin-type N-terminal cleavage/methylation domain-containing protein
MRINFKKINKKQAGFTLAELMISILIFSMMMTALVTIYGTINKHMFQSYRQNIVKNNLAIAVKAIQIRLMTATRVDTPAFGSRGNTLAFVTNVDKQSGCSPVNAAISNTWHYFCKSGTNVYYHTGNVPSTTGGCPCTATHSNRWRGLTSYPIGFCGPGGGGSVTQLLNNSQIPAMGRLFSRRSADGIREIDQVAISLRSTSNTDGARPIDVTLGAVVHSQTTP